ncbi:MAG: hypothetical protein P3T54_01345 [Dehalogenimonas sp.]|uniref:Peptidase MA-like domain-containing protein n=1 Tax=Candidatus Dehalogenimonas loeffleri TaxID=3127115 RepID=A0ABZ2J5R6_9CHLR|nr:hypothetical protein [Dehalogenimonas sp.]
MKQILSTWPVLQTVFSFIAKFTLLLFFCVILTLLCGAIYLEMLFPRQIANPILLTFTAFAILVLAGFFTQNFFKNLSRYRPASKPANNKQNKVILVFLAFFLLMLASVWIYKDHIKPEALLARAEKQFEIVLRGEIPVESVRSTLVILQEEIERLRKQYKPSNTYDRITIYLYPNIVDFRSDTGQNDAHGAFSVLNDGSPLLFLVAEKARDSMKSNITTPTPSHEISHLVIYETLGAAAIEMFPRGIYEGLAVKDSLKGFQRFPERIFLRLDLMMSSVNTHDIKNFLVYGSPSESMRASQLYSTSYEFVEYLSSRYGDYLFTDIFRYMTDGNHFLIGFYRTVGLDFGEVYEEWVDRYFLERQLVE